MLDLNTSVQYVKGVGPRLADVLGAKGIHTVHDLLHYLPFRYEDRLNPRSVEELRAGEMATVIAEVRNSGLFRTRRMPIFETGGRARPGQDPLPLVQRHLSQRSFQTWPTDCALRQGRTGSAQPGTATGATAVRDSRRGRQRYFGCGGDETLLPRWKWGELFPSTRLRDRGG